MGNEQRAHEAIGAWFSRIPLLDRDGEAGGFARRVLLDFLDKNITDARVLLRFDGGEVVVGASRIHPPDVAVSVHRRRLFGRILSLGNLGLGEAYMDGDFDVDHGALDELLTIFARNRLDEKLRREPLLLATAAGVRLKNLLRDPATNVQRHYDLGDDLFESFLDPTMTYSCGYATSDDDDLATLQQNKLDRICRKLRLRPGDRLLDIGCGFGGLLIHAALHHGAIGVGITNSKRHAARAAELARSRGVGDRVTVRFGDFREAGEKGAFDRVVSVGMMEHLQRRRYGRYFDVIRDALTPDGFGLVHAIGANAARNEHDPFFQKYIFPDSSQPRLSDISGHLERTGLFIVDVENLVRHYAPTVRRWLENFRANRGTLDPRRYDETFFRMWEYYFCCGITAARATDSSVYQVLFTRNRAAALPYQRV